MKKLREILNEKVKFLPHQWKAPKPEKKTKKPRNEDKQ